MRSFSQFFKKQVDRTLGLTSKEDTDFENLVRKDGVQHAGKRIAEVLNEQIKSEDLAKQFVVEELDAARQGNEFAKNFVINSGFKSSEYIGALNRTSWEGEESELERIQLFLRGAFLMKISDIDLQAQVSVTVVDEIMKIWQLGKYSKQQTSPLKGGGMGSDEPLKSGFPTISFLNRLISVGAEREFVIAVCAIWFVQASNDPNTQESQQIAGGIIGTLENFFVEEAHAIDVDVFKLFTGIINNSEYGALFEEAQPIYDAGRKAVNEKFPPGSTSVMEIYSHYANVMLDTTKQNKKNLLGTLQVLGQYVDMMCGLANQAEKDLF